jgi:hypothetical protein
MARQPLPDGRMLVGGAVVGDRVDGPADGDFAFDTVLEADEFLMPMALHVAPDHSAVQDVHRREQGRCSVAFVVMGLLPVAFPEQAHILDQREPRVADQLRHKLPKLALFMDEAEADVLAT